MKKGFIAKTMVFLAVMICFSITCRSQASAANKVNITLQEVEDIDNVPFPTLSLVYFYGSDIRVYSEFTINSPGQVRTVLRWGVGVKGNGNAWISRDPEGYDIVGKIADITTNKYDVSWFLDKGTYYVNYTWSGGTYEVGVSLLYENSFTQETVETSGYAQSNFIALKTPTRGFLSETTPNDYYYFELKKKANVTIEYSFDTSYNASGSVGYCTLYDINKLSLAHGTYKMSDKGSLSLTYLLEPGVYYIKLNGIYGNTMLNIEPMYYDITLTPDLINKWTKDPIMVDIDTSIDYSEIRVIKKDVKDTVLDNKEVWGSNNIKLDGESFEVTENGVYSVRITDKHGNYALEKIEITNIDTKKPKIKGIKGKQAYNKAVTITWTDDLSGIDTSKATLNGKAVKSGVTVKEQGEYVLKVFDKIGNKRQMKFYIDNTAPTAGIDNGKTYEGTVTLRFGDEISGIKKILVNDAEISKDTKTSRYYLDGEYIVELWDNADNYRKVKFTIK